MGLNLHSSMDIPRNTKPELTGGHPANRHMRNIDDWNETWSLLK